MARHLLSDKRVRDAKPADALYRLADGENLYLAVLPSGVKSWQLRYRHNGAPMTATIGKYPSWTLAEARDEAEKLRKLAKEGEHLTAHKKVEKATKGAQAATTFDKYAAKWIDSEARRQEWSADYKEEVAASIRNHLAPLNGLPLAKITAAMVAPLMKSVDRKAPHMREKVNRRLHAVFNDALLDGLIPANPLPVSRRQKIKGGRKHFPAVLTLKGVGEVLRAARASDPCKGIQRAHLLLVYGVQRVGKETVPAKWSEFELDGIDIQVDARGTMRHFPNAGNWVIARSNMKNKNVARGDQIVPLPPALLAMLREWRKADGEGAIYVCPAPRDAKRHITEEAVEKHYRRALKLAGIHSPHSWRRSFSTIARDAGKDHEAIERQLDHEVGNKVQSAYDAAQRVELRRALMEWYEETVNAARDGAEVIPIPRKKA